MPKKYHCAIICNCAKRESKKQELNIAYGGIPEWPKGADCKSVSIAFSGSNPLSPTQQRKLYDAGVAELADAQDLKSCGTYTPVPVRFRSPALKKDRTQCSVFFYYYQEKSGEYSPPSSISSLSHNILLSYSHKALLPSYHLLLHN